MLTGVTLNATPLLEMLQVASILLGESQVPHSGLCSLVTFPLPCVFPAYSAPVTLALLFPELLLRALKTCYIFCLNSLSSATCIAILLTSFRVFFPLKCHFHRAYPDLKVCSSKIYLIPCPCIIFLLY